jgi:hypothetical protein
MRMELRCRTRQQSNPQCIAEMFNLYFTEIVGKLVKQNNSVKLCCQVPRGINNCNETMFIFPVTEIEIVDADKNFRGETFGRY